jgi:hypothetical protein
MALALGSSPVSGQDLSRSRFTDPAVLIQNAAVRKHLELDPAVEQKAFQIPILIRQAAVDDAKALKQIADPQERERKKQELRRRTLEKGVAELKKILEPEDLVRLQQIALQMADFQAFETAEVKEKLKLTAEQQQKLQVIIQNGNEEMRQLVARAGVGAGDVERMWAVTIPSRKKAMGEAVAVLNPDQQKTWQGMVGAPFDFSLERPGKELLPKGGGPPAATEQQKADPQWVAARVREWMPSGKEKSFDQIGWVTELCEATRLAKEHNRGVFIFVIDGKIATGRC